MVNYFLEIRRLTNFIVIDNIQKLHVFKNDFDKIYTLISKTPN